MSKMDSLPPADVVRAPEPGWRPWVYLASGLGFSARERALVLPELVAALEAAGLNVFEPFADNNEGAKSAATQAPGWAHRIGQADVEGVRRCDAVVCCCNGNPPDEGAMVELGIAIGLRKPAGATTFTRRSPSSPTRKRRSRGGSPARTCGRRR